MSPKRWDDENPRIQNAVEELKTMILARYPNATFEVAEGEDPDGIYLYPTVDVEDTMEVLYAVMDRVLEMEIEEDLPIYVVPLPPLERSVEWARRYLAARELTGRSRALDP